MTQQLLCGNKLLDLGQPVVMGILNVTPDSFSDGGAFYRGRDLDVELACQRALEMVAEGAAIIDIGGESTRPGAEKVGLKEEKSRVLPVVEALAKQSDVIISLDTSSVELMDEGLALGANMVNDVRALAAPQAVDVVAKHKAGVCLMHMQGQPKSMQANPHYQNVVEEVKLFLHQRLEVCLAAGIRAESICLDPGFGFGKSSQDNLRLLACLDELAIKGFPLLAGLSRKSLIAAVLDNALDERLAASIALAALAVSKGANIVRVHDVKASCDAIAMAAALMKYEKQ